MATILIVALCIAVIISAIAAERSARAHRRFRAVCLNLFGIGCLGVGLLSLYGWCQGHVVGVRQVAMARLDANPGTVVELLLDSDQPVELLPDSDQPVELLPDSDQPVELLPDSDQPVERAKPETPDAGAATTVELEPGTTPPTDDAASELTAEAPDPQPAEDGDPEVALPEEMRAQIQIDYAARPAWVDREARDEGPVHQVSVSAGPYRASDQAERELKVELKRVTDEYINELLQSSTAARWIAYDVSRISKSLVAPGNFYHEKVISPSVGVMYQSHALLEFGPEFHRDVERTWQQIVVRARLVKVAMGAAAVLGTLALLFSYFQADTATKGFYTGRLKFVTFVAILGLIMSGVLLARSIPWLWP